MKTGQSGRSTIRCDKQDVGLLGGHLQQEQLLSVFKAGYKIKLQLYLVGCHVHVKDVTKLSTMYM